MPRAVLLGDAVDPSAVTIDKLYLTNVPLQVALQYICDKAKLRYKVDEYAVTLLPLTSDETDDIVTRRWSVPPTFENFLDSGGGGDGATGDADPFATEDAGGGKGIKPRKPIQELLREQGVVFIDGTSASLLTGSGTLVVRNTPTQLELIDAIVEAAGKETPRQIRVLTKFVEVTQENSDELSLIGLRLHLEWEAITSSVEAPSVVALPAPMLTSSTLLPEQASLEFLPRRIRKCLESRPLVFVVEPLR